MNTRIFALGFACDTARATADTIARLAQGATRTVTCDKGDYRVWRSSAGAELWFHYPVGDSGEAGADDEAPIPMGMTPFHRGVSDLTIRVDRAVMPEKLNPLEGNFRATLRVPNSAGPHPQLRLEMVPFALQRRSRRPFNARAQIVCFTYELRAFESTRDYLRSTPPHRLISPGSMTAVRKKELPEFKMSPLDSDFSLGLVTGVVEKAVRLRNPESGLPYYWIQLATDAGAIDVVTNPQSVRGDISEGHVAQVCGSFIARLIGGG